MVERKDNIVENEQVKNAESQLLRLWFKCGILNVKKYNSIGICQLLLGCICSFP